MKPVTIELTDFKTKKVVDTLEVDACMVATGRAPYTNGLNLGAIHAETDKRGFVPVNEKMQVRAQLRIPYMPPEEAVPRTAAERTRLDPSIARWM